MKESHELKLTCTLSPKVSFLVVVEHLYMIIHVFWNVENHNLCLLYSWWQPWILNCWSIIIASLRLTPLFVRLKLSNREECIMLVTITPHGCKKMCWRTPVGVDRVTCGITTKWLKCGLNEALYRFSTIVIVGIGIL